MRRTSGVRDGTRSCSSGGYGSGADGSSPATSERNDRNESAPLDEMLLQQTPLACFENFFLLLAIGRRFGERHFERPAEEAASVERVHGFHGVVALLKVDEGVIFDLLDALDRSVSLERLLQLLFCEVLRQVSNVQHFHLEITKSNWLKYSKSLNTQNSISLKMEVGLTLDIVSVSGSSWGSAQSTMISQPKIFTRPVLRRRLASDADLCESYSRKQKPRFLRRSSGEL